MTDPNLFLYRSTRFGSEPGEQHTDSLQDISSGKNSNKPAEDLIRDRAENKSGPLHRVYAAFNAEQIDGIPKRTQPVHQNWASIQAGERILDNTGAVIRHDKNDLAFYNITTDVIHCLRQEALKMQSGITEQPFMSYRTGVDTDAGSTVNRS